jgi:acyl phosphate:glycerol-3-phosphate acyltransferase
MTNDFYLTAGLCVLGYLLGSIPFGLLLTKAAGFGDIRQVGSGNIGATNVLRTGNKGLAAATLLLDALKGVAAVLIASAAAGETAALLAALAAVVGHLFPVWIGFNGGKGVATGLGVLIAASWPVGVGACLVWLLAAKFGKISSLAALTAFVASPVLAALLGQWGVVKLAFTIAVLVFARHHANIRRLLAGTEPRIGQGKAEAT